MSTTRRIVSDAGPLISLEKLTHGYSFIRQLYDVILVPKAVLEEVARGQHENAEAYLRHYQLADLIEVKSVTASTALPKSERLHTGEVEAIQLALELHLPLLIEERVGRRVAEEVGVKVSGIAGQIVRAYRLGVLTRQDAEAKLDEMLAAGRISIPVYEALIEAVGKEA